MDKFDKWAISYLRIRDTFTLSPCTVGFALCNIREIYFLQISEE